jgi:hypothetical protein
MALTKPRRTHETSGAMDSRSMTGPFFEVPLSLSKDSQGHRSVQRYGQVVTGPILGGLHHQYCQM